MINSFSIQPDYQNSREGIAIIQHCLNNHKTATFRILNNPIHGTIPIGSINYCEHLLPKYETQLVNFYPQFLNQYLHRNIKITKYPPEIGYNQHIKQATSWKPTENPQYYYISDYIPIIDEWRYYIAKSQLIEAHWYTGQNEEAPAPKIDINWPQNFSGAVDFGTTDQGIMLIEAHPPYACGWYGDKLESYAQWQIPAWYSFLENHSKWRYNQNNQNNKW